MFEYYFTFRSVTGAQRAENVLRQEGIPGRLLRAPKFLSLNGCGYAIRIRSTDGRRAAAAFRANRAEYSRVFRVFSSGGVEETAL